MRKKEYKTALTFSLCVLCNALKKVKIVKINEEE